MAFSSSIRAAKMLSLSEAKQIVGEWMTYCRIARKRGEATPPIVLQAAKTCAADRNKSMTDEDWAAVARSMRERRIKKGYLSAAAIANRFPKTAYEGKAKLVISKRRAHTSGRPRGKAEWTEVHLEIDHQISGYAHRFKASRQQSFHRLTRLKAGKPPSDAPKTTKWCPITLEQAGRISAIARNFLEHMLSKGESTGR